MRKLKLQMQITLDGFNSTGPNDEQQWVTWDLDGIRKYVIDLLDSSDTVIIGRKLAVDYIPYWDGKKTSATRCMILLRVSLRHARSSLQKHLNNQFGIEQNLQRGSH